MAIEVKPVDRARCAEAGATLARAFDSDPMWQYLLPDETKRLGRLAWLFERWTRIVARLGTAHVTGGGVALWLSPDHGPSLGLWPQLRAGLALGPFRLGWGLLPRSWPVQADMARRYRREVQEPHWVLDVLGVDPAHQRGGVGAALVRPVLERADRDGVPCYVVTHNAANVPYYEQFGFRVTEERRLGVGGISAYALRRPVPE